MPLQRRYIAASTRQKIQAVVCLVFGAFMGAVGIGLLNPLDPMSWCSDRNGCVLYPDNRISLWLGLTCDAASTSLIWAADASLVGKRTAWLALPIGMLSLAFVVYVVERLAHAWP